jgi:DNA-binding transcriptional regulator YiaG
VFKCLWCNAELRSRVVGHAVTVSEINVFGRREQWVCPLDKSHTPYVTPSEQLSFDLRVAEELARRSVCTGEALKVIRTALRMRGEDVAEAFGVTKETVSRWETGEDLKVGRLVLALLGEVVIARQEGRSSPMNRVTAIASKSQRPPPVTIALPSRESSFSRAGGKLQSVSVPDDVTIDGLQGAIQSRASELDRQRLEELDEVLQARALVSKVCRRLSRREAPTGAIRRPPVAMGMARCRAEACIWVAKHALDWWARDLAGIGDVEPPFEAAMNVLRGGSQTTALEDDCMYLSQLLVPVLNEEWYGPLVSAQLAQAFGSAFGRVELSPIWSPIRRALGNARRKQLPQARAKAVQKLAIEVLVEAHRLNGGGRAPADPGRFSFPVPGHRADSLTVGANAESIRKQWQRRGPRARLQEA